MIANFSSDMAGTYVKTTEEPGQAGQDQPAEEEHKETSQERVDKAVSSLISRLKSLFSWFK